jgi:hypothetical protein
MISDLNDGEWAWRRGDERPLPLPSSCSRIPYDRLPWGERTHSRMRRNDNHPPEIAHQRDADAFTHEGIRPLYVQ